MALLTDDQIKQLIKERNIKTVEDIESTIKDLFADTIQAMLEAEMDHHLGYEKNDTKNKDTANRRNGHGTKKLRSSHGEMEIEVPRDRDGEFEPMIVEKRQKSISQIEQQIIALYAKGISTREIQDYLHQLYGIEVSPALISNITDKIVPMIKEWQSRPLEPVYAVVFMDAIHYKVRQDSQITNKAAYMVIGVDLEGKKDVLGIWIGESESAKFWLSVLNEMKNRGVQDILIVSVDNLGGFSETISAAYPQTEIQKCIVHQVRNSIRYVSYKDVKKVTTDLKKIYGAPSESAGLEELDLFADEWGKKYPYIVQSWRNNWSEIATFFKYPPEIRKIIYTTNIIESYHRQLRKATKGKSIFPTDEALMKMLYLVTQDVTRKWTMRIPNWGQILAQFAVFFPDRVKPLEG
jgi:transposase-like protein